MRKRKKVEEMGRNEDFEGVSDLYMTEKAEVYARLRRVFAARRYTPTGS